MANEYYIPAGIIPNDTGEAETANQFFITAGIVPDDAAGAPPATSIPVIMNFYRQLRMR